MKGFLFLMVFIVFFSCAEKLMEPPANLIPQEKMVAILRDLAILNSAKSINKTVLYKNDIEPMRYLYAKYGIDSTQLINSDRYYASIPETYEEIYTTLEEMLNTEKEGFEEMKKVRDSLKKLENDLKRKGVIGSDSLR